MKSGIQVADAMTTNPISVSKDISLSDCAKIMRDTRVGAVVAKENGTSTGILTEKDIVKKAVAEGVNVKKAKVGDFMKEKPITIQPGEDIYDALIKMRDNNIRHLPVVDGRSMIGLLTIKDILKIEPDLFDVIVEKIELKEESRKPVNNVQPSEGICQLCGRYSEKTTLVNEAVVCETCAEQQTTIS